MALAESNLAADEYIVLSSDSSNTSESDPPAYESDGCDSVVYLGTSMGRPDSTTVKVELDPDKYYDHDSSK